MRIKNPCGCVSDERKWITLCIEHKRYHESCLRASDLTSVARVIQDYERDPTDDNLGHACLRIKKHGDIVAEDKPIASWIIAHRADLQRISAALARNWKPK